MDESDYKKTMVLVGAARTVLSQFQSGHHPTESQLDRLDAACEQFDGTNICGHMFIEDCDCLRADPPRAEP